MKSMVKKLIMKSMVQNGRQNVLKIIAGTKCQTAGIEIKADMKEAIKVKSIQLISQKAELHSF